MDTALALLGPADALRRWWLRLAGPRMRELLVDRDRRVSLGFSSAVLVAAVLAAVAPLHLLAIGPLVLGVPHVLADLRYLVARRGLHRRVAFLAFVGGPLGALLVTRDVRIGFLAVVGAGLAATRAKLLARALLIAVGAALTTVACARPVETGFVVAHGHNVVAVIALMVLHKGDRRAISLPVALYGTAAMIILAGATMPIAAALGTTNGAVLGITLDQQSFVLAPILAAPWDARVVVLFAFAQSVHYGLWLRVIPDAVRPGKTPRSFTQSAAALTKDVGSVAILATLALMAGLATYAVADAAAARTLYFGFALFHGYLELAALGMRGIERSDAA